MNGKLCLLIIFCEPVSIVMLSKDPMEMSMRDCTSKVYIYCLIKEEGATNPLKEQNEEKEIQANGR